MFKVQDRRPSKAIKWQRVAGTDLIPMWVADMDLATAPVVSQALAERTQHPVYGYTHPWPSLNQAVVNWCQARYQWAIEADWILWQPGVVPSINMLLQSFTRGGRVLVQTPNYPPLLNCARLRGCEPRYLETLWLGDRWGWDWQLLTNELAHPDCQVMILCNPMNPQGELLGQADLARLAELCAEHQVLLISDEIHCDLILDGQGHVPAGSLPLLQDRSITLMAASKSFNVAGLGCSFAIIPNPELRQQYRNSSQDLLPYPNLMGLLAAEAAFSAEGWQWLVQLQQFLRGNQQLVSQCIKQLPGLDYQPRAATFLAWITSELPPGLLQQEFIKAGILTSPGQDFGQAQHARLNFGTDRATLERALALFSQHWLKHCC